MVHLYFSHYLLFSLVIRKSNLKRIAGEGERGRKEKEKLKRKSIKGRKEQQR